MIIKDVAHAIALKYFLARRGLFVSLLSIVAVFGVAVGVFALIVVLSVMTGFTSDLQQRLMGVNAHLVVEGVADFDPVLEKIGDQVSASVVALEAEGIIKIEGEDSGEGVRIRGIDLEDLDKLRGVEWYIGEASENSAFLGSELSSNLSVYPDFDDKIILVSPLGRVGPTGDLLPEKMTFNVAGLFRSGYFEFDSQTVIISKAAAKKLFGEKTQAMLHVWLKDASHARNIATRLKETNPELKLYTWQEVNRKLFSALRLERIAMGGLLSLIVILASLSILSVIFMYVFLRRRDVAILASMGMTPRIISHIFVCLGAYIGLVGSVLGAFAGFLVCSYLASHQIRLPQSYYLDYLPVVFSWPLASLIAAGGVFMAVIAAWYPSREAARLSVVEIIRYE